MDSINLSFTKMISICWEYKELLIFKEKASTAKLPYHISSGFRMVIAIPNLEMKIYNQVAWYVVLQHATYIVNIIKDVVSVFITLSEIAHPTNTKI